MELTLEQALQKGIEAHKAGKAQEADRYYTAVLKAQPKHPNANHNMGVLAVGVGKVEQALPFFKTALELNPDRAQFWLSYIDALIKLDRTDDARTVLDQAKSHGSKGDGFDQLEKKLGSAIEPKARKIQEPTKDQVQSLVNLYNQGQLQEVLSQASKLLTQFPGSVTLYNIVGAANQGLGKLEEATDAYKEALSIKPDFAEAYSNMGNALKDQGKLEEAIEAYSKALSIKPDYAQSYNNMGVVLRERDKLAEAIEAYRKALEIEPGNAEIYNNMGVTIQEQGKLEEAIEAYQKALALKPDFAEAHRNLSSIKKYNSDDKHFLQVKRLYGEEGLSKEVRCNLNFALAKMYEDMGEPEQTFEYLAKGNALRKKLLKYSIEIDKSLFINLKNTQLNLLKNSLKIKESSLEPTPIFIIGMPRSGTTLVEQIISSHSEVTGAGELDYVSQFGGDLVLGLAEINTVAISNFRGRYLSKLSKLSKLSNGKSIVTDKMPQNFRFIGLIAAAFPEAKIIHLKRNPAAVCWANFKKLYPKSGLGYCYSIEDTVTYHGLYKNLMEHWRKVFDKRIYDLDYELLVQNQENETRKVIDYLELNWDERCLSPHKNNNNVATGSSIQVREKVYKGSSKQWLKYEPFLNGAFDSLL